MTKGSMVARDILYLTIDTFLDVVIKKNFPLLPVVENGNRYLPIGSNENKLYISSTGNAFVARCNTTGNHATYGFFHDSLNSLNSEKVIWGKLKYVT